MRNFLNVAPTTVLVLVLLALTLVAFGMVRSRAMASVGGDSRKLHSLPNYYGYNAALFTAIPSLFVLVAWLLIQPVVIQNAVIEMIPQSAIAEGSSVSLVMSDVTRVANGLDAAVQAGAIDADRARNLSSNDTDVRALLAESGVALGSDVSPEVLAAAQRYRSMQGTGRLLMIAIVSTIALAGLLFAFRVTTEKFRARNMVERFLLSMLIAAASLAILTTVGIVLSMLFETINFFKLHPWQDFFLGTTWAPNFRGDSELSILPLLWGTLYISLIALLVAVPIGLFAAIYLSEYANGKVRAFAKPLLLSLIHI